MTLNTLCSISGSHRRCSRRKVVTLNNLIKFNWCLCVILLVLCLNLPLQTSKLLSMQ